MAYQDENGKWDSNGHKFDDINQAKMYEENMRGSQSSSSSSSSSSSGPLVTHTPDIKLAYEVSAKDEELAKAQSGEWARIFGAVLDDYSKMIKYYNSGNWDGIIKTLEASENSWYRSKTSMRIRHQNGFILEGIALAYRDGDYISAFSKACWGKPVYSKPEDFRFNKNEIENEKIFMQAAFIAGKKAWERANGRAMTDDDVTQVHVDHLESIINGVKKGYSIPDVIKRWEEVTGKKLDKKEKN